MARSDNSGVLAIGGAWRTKSSNGGAIAICFVAIDEPSQKQHCALPTKTIPPCRPTRVVDLEMVDLQDVKKHIVMGIASQGIARMVVQILPNWQLDRLQELEALLERQRETRV